MTASQFLCGEFPDGKDQTFESLQPAGMTPLAEAPEGQCRPHARDCVHVDTNRCALVRSCHDSHHESIVFSLCDTEEITDAAPKPVGALGHTDAEQVRQHFVALQGNVGGANRWDARVDNTKVDVDESEWD
jgi:hypothetical protein